MEGDNLYLYIYIFSDSLDLVFAWGAAYISMSDDGTADRNDHTMYYQQARRYLGDFINSSLANLDRVSCLFLASLYFLMIHRPYRFPF